MGATV